MRLTKRFVDTVDQPGRYIDEGRLGLMLAVRSATSKSWVQQLQVNGKRKCFGLGSVKHLSLKEARDKAYQNQKAARDGNGLGRDGGMPTFRDAALKVIESHQSGWNNAKTAQNWHNVFESYVFPAIGNLPIDKPTTAHVMDILQPLWNVKQSTAKKVRQRTSKVFRWAVARGYRPDNPAGEALLAALPKVTVQVQHNRCLPYDKVNAALDTVRRSSAYEITKLALEFTVLSCCRSGEVRGAQWTEFDLQNKVWTIPASRMKMKREHRVPLSTRAIEILERARALSDSAAVFPSPRGKQLSDNTLSKLLRDNRIDSTVHGFRSSFRDWAAEQSSAPREVAEFALAHIEGSAAELAYRRTDYFEKRRELMQQWADYLQH